MNIELNQQQLKKGGIIFLILIVLYLFLHYFTKSSGPEIPAPKVVVQKPAWQEIVDYVTQTGSLVAYNSVDLVARVEGYLTEIKFVDGAFVKKGQELLIIQPEPYLEQLKAAEATVRAQKAVYEYSKAEYARQKRMYQQNATSLNSVEKWKAKTEESQAEIDKAVANAIIAEINYGYTHVTSPFAGRIGRHLVDPGNLVGNGVATNLATVEEINPIYAYFNLNELDLIKLREAARAHGFKPGDISQIPVSIKLQNESSYTHQGKLDFANTGLNASTGTLEFRALLENKDYALLPGLFVSVRIPVSAPKKELTIPDYAVLYDQIGPYVLTVDASNLAQLKRITPGKAEHGMMPVVKGLNENDRVIINGLQFVTPGNPVVVQEQQKS